METSYILRGSQKSVVIGCADAAGIKTERHAMYLWLSSPGRRLKLQKVLLHLFIHLHDGCHVSCSTIPSMRRVSHIMQSIDAFHLFRPAPG